MVRPESVYLKLFLKRNRCAFYEHYQVFASLDGVMNLQIKEDGVMN